MWRSVKGFLVENAASLDQPGRELGASGSLELGGESFRVPRRL